MLQRSDLEDPQAVIHTYQLQTVCQRSPDARCLSLEPGKAGRVATSWTRRHWRYPYENCVAACQTITSRRTGYRRRSEQHPTLASDTSPTMALTPRSPRSDGLVYRGLRFDMDQSDSLRHRAPRGIGPGSRRSRQRGNERSTRALIANVTCPALTGIRNHAYRQITTWHVIAG